MTPEELKEAFGKLEYNPKIDTLGDWSRHRKSIRNHVNKDSAYSMLRWSTLIGTMVVGDTPYVRTEYRLLPDSIIRKIDDGGFGSPPMLFGTRTSANYAHQSFYLHTWMELTGLDISSIENIVEFGGGYGAMAVVSRALGFSGTYSIYDLPELSIIQEYYLSNVGCEAHMVPIDVWQENGIHKDYSTDLLIAAYSLSETRANFREAFFDAIQPKHCLIAHQPVWQGEDLIAYFADFMEKRPQYTWHVAKHPDKSMSGHQIIAGDK